MASSTKLRFCKTYTLLRFPIYFFLLLFAFSVDTIRLSAAVEITQNNSKSNVTLVSGFLSQINTRQDRTIENYVKWSQHLLKCNIPKVIFLEQSIYDLYYSKNYANGLYPQTYFVFIDHNSLSLSRYRKQITHPATSSNPSKDSLDYLLVQCNKTDWVHQAIDLNIFETDQYVWVDFGLYSIYQDPKGFADALYALQNKNYQNIRIGKIWNLAETPESKRLDIYKTVAWYFAGGVFGGHKDQLVLFNLLMQEKCKEIILQKHALMWEVNVWYLIYLENSHLFNPYYCNHDPGLLVHY